MSDFVVSARKYRPSTFKDVVGQEALTTTLKNAIQRGTLSHAYLFCGPRGVGKTSCARIFAKTINCLNITEDGEACNECEKCLEANEQRSYNIFELDAASNNSVDDIRQLIEQVYVAPATGKYRVYIIDEVHMLSTSAFNAFLKTLEEPPAHAIFVLATTERHKVLPTIISRCQVHDFHRITAQDIAAHLSYVAHTEGIAAEEDALMMIAIAADGGMRDALSMLDQIAGYGHGEITVQGVRDNLNLLDDTDFFTLLAHIYRGLHAQVLTLVDELLRRGYESSVIMRGFSAFLRNVILSQNSATAGIVEAPMAVRQRLVKAGQAIPPYLVWEYLKVSTAYGAQARELSDRRLALEVALLRMVELSPQSTIQLPPPTTYQPSDPTVEAAVGGAPRSTAPASQAIPSGDSPQGRVQETHAQYKPVAPMPTTHASNTTPKAPKQRTERYGFSLDEEEIVEADHAHYTLRDTPYTQEMMLEAWMKARRDLVSDPILAAIMLERVPQMDDAGQLYVDVQSNTEGTQLEGHRSQIESIMADALANDHVHLTLRVLATDHSARRPATDADVVAYFREQNEDFDFLVSELNLKIV